MRDSGVTARPGLLVVEDDPAQLECLRRLLKEGWNVFFAQTLSEAETALARHPEIGILLCDHELPDGKGLAFCERLHARMAPVIRILITGNTDIPLLVRAVNTQCLFRFLPKPYDVQALHALLDQAGALYREQELDRKARVESEREQQRRAPRRLITRWAQIIFGLGSFLLATLVVIALVTLVVGAFVFVVLYVLKSFLGIDIFADRHLEDFLPF